MATKWTLFNNATKTSQQQSALTMANIAMPKSGAAPSLINPCSASAPPVILLPPKPLNDPFFTSDEDFDTYFSLAKELGICNKEMVREQIRQISKEQSYGYYQLSNAFAFLNYKIGTDWKMYPVRPIDTELEGWSLKKSDEQVVTVQKYCYDRKIPMRILEKIQTISNAVPSARFVITDIPTLNITDIFLIFIASNGELPAFICDHWEEETF